MDSDSPVAHSRCWLLVFLRGCVLRPGWCAWQCPSAMCGFVCICAIAIGGWDVDWGWPAYWALALAQSARYCRVLQSANGAGWALVCSFHAQWLANTTPKWTRMVMASIVIVGSRIPRSRIRLPYISEIREIGNPSNKMHKDIYMP